MGLGFIKIPTIQIRSRISPSEAKIGCHPGKYIKS
jgi:hypothetical protein